jgi:glycosyltransferase involved in cell wall biosynthesis
MRCFYNSGDVLYFPTNYEGFSMATLEAMAAGVPVIGTEFAVPEELRQYDFAKIIDTSNPETVLAEVDSMAQKYKNKRIDLHNAIIKDFGYEQYKDKLLALIQGAMNG